MKATPEEIAKVLDREIESLRHRISELTERIQFITSHHWRICKVGVMPSVTYGGIEFDNCERDEALAVMKAFGGKWDKSPNYQGKGIDYRQHTEDFERRITISNAKPPPSCQVVEEEVLIEAQPARMEKRFKLQCVKPVKGETASLPTPEPPQVQSVTEITLEEVESA